MSQLPCFYGTRVRLTCVTGILAMTYSRKQDTENNFSNVYVPCRTKIHKLKNLQKLGKFLHQIIQHCVDQREGFDCKRLSIFKIRRMSKHFFAQISLIIVLIKMDDFRSWSQQGVWSQVWKGLFPELVKKHAVHFTAPLPSRLF